MKKGTSIVLLSIISLIMAFLLVMTFVRFPVNVKNYNSVLGAIELDHGMSESGIYTLTLNQKTDAPTEGEMADIMDTLSYRLDKLGYDNHSISAVKNAESNVYDIRLEINADLGKDGKPDYNTLDSVVAAAIKHGELQFFSGTEANAVTEELFADIENPIKKAKNTGYNELAGGYGVSITFTDEAFDEMLALMEGEEPFYLEVKFGEETLLSSGAPLTADYFVNKAISFNTPNEARADQLVLQISSGGFDYEYKVSNVAHTSTLLGNKVGLVSVISISAILVISIIALIILNKGFGIASGLSLLAFAIINTLMMIAVPSIKLSIGGVVGIILATVLAVDGNVLIAKRIREELNSGKTVKSAIRGGFKRALTPVLNGSVVSVILSLLLFAFVSKEIRMFAITFAIGSALAFVSALVFTRMFIALLLPLVKNKEKFLNAKREEV